MPLCVNFPLDLIKSLKFWQSFSAIKLNLHRQIVGKSTEEAAILKWVPLKQFLVEYFFMEESTAKQSRVKPSLATYVRHLFLKNMLAKIWHFLRECLSCSKKWIMPSSLQNLHYRKKVFINFRNPKKEYWVKWKIIFQLIIRITKINS